MQFLNHQQRPLSYGIGSCAVILVAILVQSSTHAECGGYVTIGNKAKLEELRANGYLPKMNSHAPPQKEDAENESNNSASINGLVSSVAFQKHFSKSIPQAPCSGPNCHSGDHSNPASPPIILIPTNVKSGLEANTKRLSWSACDSFVGFSCVDETPIRTIRELDRPPE